MIINIDLPDAKIDALVAIYQARYGQTDSFTKTADKKQFLEKIVQHELLSIVRQQIVEEAQVAARTQILADTDINKTLFEADLEEKASTMNVAQPPEPIVAVEDKQS